MPLTPEARTSLIKEATAPQREALARIAADRRALKGKFWPRSLWEKLRLRSERQMKEWQLREREKDAAQVLEEFDNMKWFALSKGFYGQMITNATAMGNTALVEELTQDHGNSVEDAYRQRNRSGRSLQARIVEEVALTIANKERKAHPLTIVGKTSPTAWNPLLRAAGVRQAGEEDIDLSRISSIYDLLGFQDKKIDIPIEMPKKRAADPYDLPNWQVRVFFVYSPERTRNSGEEDVRIPPHVTFWVRGISPEEPGTSGPGGRLVPVYER